MRSHNEALNKSSHLLLMVRHMFKIAYFNEMKSDLHSAHKSYQTAYALMLEAKRTDFNLSELRTVAGKVPRRARSKTFLCHIIMKKGQRPKAGCGT